MNNTTNSTVNAVCVTFNFLSLLAMGQAVYVKTCINS
jgi:hypothetical protein